MELVQSRIITDDVGRLAAFYAALVGTSVALNDYYVEVPTGAMSVGFSRRGFTEHTQSSVARPARRGEVILDFAADDVDGEYPRIQALDVRWVLPPATQPWGNRSMMFADPEGNLINVFSPGAAAQRADG